MAKRYEKSFMGLNETCIDLLAREAGTVPTRAAALVTALEKASAQEALAVMAGDADAGGTQLDSRVRRLATLLTVLAANEPPPTPFELGAMFKLTVSQASSCLRSYKARFPNEYRSRMKPTISSVANSNSTSVDSDGIVSLEFNALEPLAYAAEELQRRGYTKSLKVDRSALKVSVHNVAPGAPATAPTALAFLKNITA